VPTIISQLYCLATNPDKQQRLHDEISRIIPAKKTPLTPEHLKQMSYLKACFKEGFRFFPLGSEFSREPKEDVVVGGYSIPAGVSCGYRDGKTVVIDYLQE
jgi:cytochrome P450